MVIIIIVSFLEINASTRNKKNANDSKRSDEEVGDGTFTEDVLNNVLAVLEMKPVKEKTPAGFLTEKEACDYCGDISRSTLWHWKKNGLRSYKVGGRCLYSPDDLKRFILTVDTVDAVEKLEK